jgi:hypothetical protein
MWTRPGRAGGIVRKRASRGLLLTVLALPFVLASPMCADAAARVLTVVDQARVPHRVVMAEERALVQQALQLRRYWHTPRVRFGPGGWKIYLVPEHVVAECGNGVPESACHQIDYTRNQPDAYVGVRGFSRAYWADSMSHEMIEMLVDPMLDRYIRGFLVEPCDPVAGNDYTLAGQAASDFVLPNFYSRSQRGQLDFLNLFARSGLYS